MNIPIFLSEFVRTIIIMSISGGAIALLLFALRPLVRHKLPKLSQYFFWSVVLFAFLVPISQVVTLPELLQTANITPTPISTIVDRNIVSVAEENQRLTSQPFVPPPHLPAPPVATTPTIVHFPRAAEAPAASPMARATTIFMFVYPWAVLLVLAYNLIGYTIFVRKLRHSYFRPYQEELDFLNKLTVGGRTPRLYCSKLTSTPMLVGIIRPIIVLPDREYTESQLQSILLHELIHMRRFDILIKWLSLFACALHWFNPLVWLMRRELDRNCELSCDESVIRNMSTSAKRIYGNTLIDVATDVKIPLPVLSTTMCEEKRALKERLGAIMKSKKHTKLAVFASMVIVLAAILAACSIGAGHSENNVTEYENGTEITNDNATDTMRSIMQTLESNAIPFPTNPTTHQDYAYLHMHYVVQDWLPSQHVQIVDYRINRFEKVAEFDHFLPQNLELWRLDFAIRVEYEPFMRWGSFTPDANGWISQATAFNSAIALLIFYEENGILHYMDYLSWHWDMNRDDDPELLEVTMHYYLASIGLVPPRVSFPGNHYFVYVWVSHDGHYGFTHRLLMSQPVRQGEGGIWTVDRLQHLFEHETFPVAAHHEYDDATMMENFIEWQREADEGITDRHFILAHIAGDYMARTSFTEHVIVVDIVEVPAGTENPFAMPRQHGAQLVDSEPDPNRMTESPSFFGAHSFHGEYYTMRAPILEQLGGLAFNQAYHLQMEDGRFALFTGWRPMISHDEMLHYTGIYVPQQVGDFTLLGVNVNDTISDFVVVYNNPIPPMFTSFGTLGHWPDNFMNYVNTSDLPINEIITRHVYVLSYVAVYVNSHGQHVGIATFQPSLESNENIFGGLPFRVENIAPYGEFVLVGSNGRYISVTHENATTQTGIEFAFVDINTLPDFNWGGWARINTFNGLVPVAAEDLIGLVDVFMGVEW